MNSLSAATLTSSNNKHEYDQVATEIQTSTPNNKHINTLGVVWLVCLFRPLPQKHFCTRNLLLKI